jgi:glycosyltransferase involved in cell wall biosynthesis
VDDCGKDGTMNVISHFQKNHLRGNDIRILTNDTNLGVSYSRNRIIDEARGRFLYFMDSDDTIEPDTIHLLYDAIVKNQAQIAYGSYEIIDGTGNSPTEKYQKDSLVLKGQDELAMYAFKNNHIFHVSVCNQLIDLSFLRQTGVRFMNVSYWEDMVYTTELVTKVTKAVLVSNITYHYVRRHGSLSHYQDREKLDKQEILRNISVINYLKDKCEDMKEKPYLPYLCSYIEMNSFYAICHIIKKNKRITPKITYYEMRDYIRHPMSLIDILRFKYMRSSNLIFCMIGKLPILLFVPVIWLLGIIKGAI